MSKTKNFFTKQLELSHKEIKGKRALMFATDAKEDSAQYIRNLLAKKRDLDRKLMNLEDFHADSTTTLKVTKDGFDSKSWVKQMNEVSFAVELVNDELSIAQKIHVKYFGGEVETGDI